MKERVGAAAGKKRKIKEREKKRRIMPVRQSSFGKKTTERTEKRKAESYAPQSFGLVIFFSLSFCCLDICLQ
jgi:hypothetical protein